jgi:hypothetical protein
MRETALLLVALLAASAVSAHAGDAKTLSTSCENAITKAEVLAAHRKWWPDRPDPKATVLNIRTHWNFSKDLVPVLGGIISHEKVGELVFQEQSGSCLVVSNGHPADVVLSDLAKAFGEPSSSTAENSKDKKQVAQDCVDNPYSLLDCHGHYKQ